jgi:hypothetical protein
MMTIASSTRRVVKQALKWMALAGAVLVMGQAPALAEDSVSVLMKQPLADMAGKVATMLTVDYTPGAASDPHSIRVRCSPTSWRGRWLLK